MCIMGSRDIEKMQKAKRRLAAVTFLTNISLDGSYKDTGWCQEQQQQRVTSRAHHHNHHQHHSSYSHSQQSGEQVVILPPAILEASGSEVDGRNEINSGEGGAKVGLTLCNGNNKKLGNKRDSAESSGIGSIYDSKSSLTIQAHDSTGTPIRDGSGILPGKVLFFGGNCAEKENTAPRTKASAAELQAGGRKRANTNDLGNFPKGVKRTDVGGEPEQTPLKHAHFSSVESIENVFPGIHLKFQKSGIPSDNKITGETTGQPIISSPLPPTSSSSSSSQPPSGANSSTARGEVKFFNLRENPNCLPLIRNERLVISVGRRSPCVVFSAIPYTKSSRFSRVQDRVQEGLKRNRNTSGSRPLSSLSEPDPLEQLLHDGDREISYGYLLKPSNHPACDPSMMAQITKSLAADGAPHILYPPGTDNSAAVGAAVPAAAASKAIHPLVSRCMSYDGVLKSTTVTPSVSAAVEPVVGSGGAAVGVVSSTVTKDGVEVVVASGPSSKEENRTSLPAPTLNNPAGLVYNPTLLDDPELRAGRHRTLMTFPSYMTSVIDYCKAADLKKELNDKFRDRFPHIQLTLSKMRSLKREMRRAAKSECNVDLLTVAQAYVYFEKLILGSFVTKFNRKYCAGACLLLSAKLNDIKGENLHMLLEKIETTFRVNRKDLLSFEFAVLVALEFALHIPAWEVAPHYQRLINEA